MGKIDFDDISSKLKEHGEGDHLTDVEERLADVHSSYVKEVGKKYKVGKRHKLNVDEAETLAHKLYDELANYIGDSYKNNSEEVKNLKGKKNKFGASMLDKITQDAFDLNRAQFVKRLKKAAAADTKFTSKYIRELMAENLEKYHGSLQQDIIQGIDTEHKEDLQKVIKNMLETYKIKDPKKYSNALRKDAELNEVIGAYATLSSNYYSPKPKK